MKILVFDTCFNKSYIVLKEDGKIISSEIIESTDLNYHSAFLIPKIRDILKNNHLLIKDIDAIGVDIGPGSFTGIRAGVTIARVLSQQANLKLAGVPSLEILSKINKSDKDTVVVLDARKNKVYFAKYGRNNNNIEPFLLDKEDLIPNLDINDVIVSDFSIYSFLSENNIKSINFEENDFDIGLYLAEITEKIVSDSQNDCNWAKVKPLYIQKPSITKQKKAAENV